MTGKVKTKLINKTGGEILLQEGNQNVYTVIARLHDDQEYVITLDPNATYRDYIILTMPNRSQLESNVTSDDCLEYSEIKVIRGDNDTCFLETKSRKTPAPANAAPPPANATPPPGNSAPAPANAASKNVFQRIKDKFSLLF